MTKEIFERHDAKDKHPKKSGWYNTDDGHLFWFSNEQQWSCRNDRISEEYPKFWYEYQSEIFQDLTTENARLREALEWHDIKVKLPSENVTCWLYSKLYKNIFLGCRVYLNNEGFFWAKSNGVIYLEENKIITECEIDDYDVTHWMYAPELPEALTQTNDQQKPQG
jgi:hypothetical protein